MCLIVPLVGMLLGVAAPLNASVTDASGAPVEGAVVWLANQYGSDGVEVLASGKTDAQGRYTAKRPDEGSGPRARLLALWAYRPGACIGVKLLPAGDEPITVVLGPAAKTPIRVFNADGAPAQGARVRLGHRRSQPPYLPVPLGDQIAVTTDAEGRAELEGLRPDEVAALDVTVEGLVTQCHAFAPTSPDEKTVRVRPVGQLVVRIVADDPNAVRGWTVTAWSAPDDPEYQGPHTSWVKSTSDDLGRVNLRPIAAGWITWRIVPPANSLYRMASPPRASVRGGERTEVTFTPQRGVPVEGTVREPDGAPVSGVKLHIMTLRGGGTNETPETDAKGKFSCVMLPGSLRVTISEFDLPKTHFQPPIHPTWVDFTVKKDDETYTLTPFELRRAVLVRGTVLDEDGKPAAGANVQGHWTHPDYPGQGGSSTASTDARGAFELPRIPPGATVKVSASRYMRAESPTVTVKGGDDTALTLTVRRFETFALRGRVLGPAARPVANARVQVHFRQPNRQFEGGAHFSFESTDAIVTGPDGRFQTPKVLPVANEYCVQVLATDMEPAKSAWTGAAKPEIADIMLRDSLRLRAIAGRVLDRRGNAVVGAEVFESLESRASRATTDGAGAFRIPDVLDAPTFVFVKIEGFRFTGARVGPGATPISLVVSRTDEPAPQPLASVAPALSRKEERALARDRLGPILKDSPPNQWGPQNIYHLLAMIDPERVLEMIENQVISADDGVLPALALGLFDENPNEALAILDGMKPALSAARGLVGLFDQVPNAPREFRRTLLDHAEARAREDQGPPEQRAITLCAIADRWFDFGAPDRGAPLVHDTQAIIAKLPKDSFLLQFGSVNATIARVDLPSALVLIERSKDDRNRATQYVQAAARIAATQPEEAERLLGLVKDEHARERGGSAVCVHMAAADLPRARRLADKVMNPAVPALLPAIAARRLAASDPKAARVLLEESFDRLEKLARSNAGTSWTAPVVWMARLLPTAARVDPERWSEYFWRTLAVRPRRAREPERMPVLPQTRQRYVAMAQLAMLIGRYDRAAGEAVFAPVAERVPGLDDERWGLGNEGNQIFSGRATVVDPRRRAFCPTRRAAWRTHGVVAYANGEVQLHAHNQGKRPPYDHPDARLSPGAAPSRRPSGSRTGDGPRRMDRRS